MAGCTREGAEPLGHRSQCALYFVRRSCTSRATMTNCARVYFLIEAAHITTQVKVIKEVLATAAPQHDQSA